MSTEFSIIHPVWLRLTHWLNVVAVVILVMSGWRIYDASPFFAFSIPKEMTLGGWLGGAIQWHFAAMWLLVANGLFYLLLNVCSGRLWRKFFPLSPRAVLRDLAAAYSVLESAAAGGPVKVQDVEEGRVEEYQKEINAHYGF